MGVIPTDGKEVGPGFAFLVPGWGSDCGVVEGTIEGVVDGAIVVESAGERDADGAPVLFKFTVLGLQDILEMRDQIGGAAELLRKAHTDAEVQRWYREEHLAEHICRHIKRQARRAGSARALAPSQLH